MLFRHAPLRFFITAAKPTTATSHARSMATMSRTLSAAIIQDHAELSEQYNKILSAKSRDEKIRWKNQFIWELARHSIGEELVVYPAMAKHLGEEGSKMAAEDRAEHLVVKQKLYDLEGMDVEDKAFEPKLRDLMENLREHIKHEESRDLPRLEKYLAQEGGMSSEAMARSFGRTKMFVPTHSHPMAPDQPPFETVVGLMAAPVDKLRDLFHKFPKDGTYGDCNETGRM